jgi:hypothetical protein
MTHLIAYRGSRTCPSLAELWPYRLAVTVPYRPSEPQEVTEARHKVRTALAATLHLNEAGLPALVDAEIYYAFTVAGFLDVKLSA